MDLIMLVLVCALVGFLVYVLTAYIPMPLAWASSIQAISLVVLILWILSRVFDLPNVLPHR